MKIRKIPAIALLALATGGCVTAPHEPSSRIPAGLDGIAQEYVELVLALGEHDPDYVDAYYGPAKLRAAIHAQPPTLADIQQRVGQLYNAIDALPPPGDAELSLDTLRRRYLKNQLGALSARARMVGGHRFSFDDEARAVYDVEPASADNAEVAAVLARIAQLLPPGRGTLAQRYNDYVDRFAVPPELLEPVMRYAINRARTATLAHLSLPAGEHFDLALVSGKPWSAYNWYQGNCVSRIEINTDLPVTISRVIELAAHEGYPGHHVYNCLLEHQLVRGRGWPEYTVYALFSPQSFIAEGSADFGVGLAFPYEQRLAFERELFERAGFDPDELSRYDAIVHAARALQPALIGAARRYLEGTASAAETQAWMQDTLLASPQRAQQRLVFLDRYRAYILNYSFGEEVVRNYVVRAGDAQPGSDAQWNAYAQILTLPRTPAELQEFAAQEH